MLIILDDISKASGPLRVIPGTHRGAIHTRWHEGVFTGAVHPDVKAKSRIVAVAVTSKAGSGCIMHTRLLHSSDPNRSADPRTLNIVE